MTQTIGVKMQNTTDSKHNVGYVRIIEDTKAAHSAEFDKDFVADFDDKDNLIGIELLDAKSYKAGDLQKLMSRANVEALNLRGRGNPETSQRSA